MKWEMMVKIKIKKSMSIQRGINMKIGKKDNVNKMIVKILKRLEEVKKKKEIIRNQKIVKMNT